VGTGQRVCCNLAELPGGLGPRDYRETGAKDDGDLLIYLDSLAALLWLNAREDEVGKAWSSYDISGGDSNRDLHDQLLSAAMTCANCQLSVRCQAGRAKQ